MESAVLSGAFDVPNPAPNEKEEAGFVAELVVETGLTSGAATAAEVDVGKEPDEANEKLDAGVVLAGSFDAERFNENPLLVAPAAGFEDVVVVPNPENTDADVTAGELPKPEKIEVVSGVVDSVALGDLDPLLSLLAENGLAVVGASPKEKPLAESPATERRDEKFGVPDGALMVTTDESSFFSDSLNVNEAFSLVDGGLFSSCRFSATFDGSL